MFQPSRPHGPLELAPHALRQIRRLYGGRGAIPAAAAWRVSVGVTCAGVRFGPARPVRGVALRSAAQRRAAPRRAGHGRIRVELQYRRNNTTHPAWHSTGGNSGAPSHTVSKAAAAATANPAPARPALVSRSRWRACVRACYLQRRRTRRAVASSAGQHVTPPPRQPLRLIWRPHSLAARTSSCSVRSATRPRHVSHGALLTTCMAAPSRVVDPTDRPTDRRLTRGVQQHHQHQHPPAAPHRGPPSCDPRRPAAAPRPLRPSARLRCHLSAFLRDRPAQPRRRRRRSCVHTRTGARRPSAVGRGRCCSWRRLRRRRRRRRLEGRPAPPPPSPESAVRAVPRFHLDPGTDLTHGLARIRTPPAAHHHVHCTILLLLRPGTSLEPQRRARVRKKKKKKKFRRTSSRRPFPFLLCAMLCPRPAPFHAKIPPPPLAPKCPALPCLALPCLALLPVPCYRYRTFCSPPPPPFAAAAAGLFYI